MFVLVWIIAIATPSGISLQEVEETIPARFTTRMECKDYAEASIEPMQYWVRGRINAPLNAPVRVSWRCEPQERTS